MALHIPKIVVVLFIFLLFTSKVSASPRSGCRLRGCTGTVFKIKDSDLTLGSFSKARCGGDCNKYRICRGRARCRIKTRTEVTWNEMLSLSRFANSEENVFNWTSRDAEAGATLSRMSIFSESIIKLKAAPVGKCNCRCREKYKDRCPRIPRASSTARQMFGTSLSRDPEERRIQRIMAYNNL